MQSRYTHALAHHGNYVYAIGGRSINGVLDSCERYSINLNRWESIAKLNQKRCTMPAVVFEDSYIYVFGGYEGSGRIDSMEQYDVTNDIWTVLMIKFPLSVEAETATLISNNEVVILGGHDNSAGTKDAMILNLESL
jgi:N-acetylneuraminic acid mutarotase